MLCPICKKGNLTAMSYPAPQEIDGEEVMVPIEYSVCDHCESEQSDSEQIEKNKGELLKDKATKEK